MHRHVPGQVVVGVEDLSALGTRIGLVLVVTADGQDLRERKS